MNRAPNNRLKRSAHTTHAARSFFLIYLRQGSRIASIAIAALCLVVLYVARELEVGSLSEPRPGMWPTGIAIGTLVISLLSAILVRDIPHPFRFRRGLHVLVLVVAMAAFWPIYEVTGFVPAATIVCFAMLRFVGHEKRLLSLGVSLVSAIAVYGVFGVILELPLSAF